MIEVSNLSFLNKIKYPDFNIEKGTLTLLCGTSGVGKTSSIAVFIALFLGSRTLWNKKNQFIFNRSNIEV